MKPSRFILNSDYATLKNDAEGTVQISLPDLVNVPSGGPNVVYKATIQIGASPSAGVRSYVTSSKYNYAIVAPSFFIACQQDGYDSVCSCDISRVDGNKIEIRVTFPSAAGEATQYTGMQQTLTLHAKTFINPFDL